MSNFIEKAVNPITLKIEDAVFMDDYYGGHKYGIKFLDGKIYTEQEAQEAADKLTTGVNK